MDKELPKRRGRPGGKVLTEEIRVRMDPEMMDKLDRLAKRRGLVRSAYVRFLLSMQPEDKP